MAFVGWAKGLAAAVANGGVTVNCIAPRRIATERVAELDWGRAAREGTTIEEVQRPFHVHTGEPLWGAC